MFQTTNQDITFAPFSGSDEIWWPNSWRIWANLTHTHTSHLWPIKLEGRIASCLAGPLLQANVSGPKWHWIEYTDTVPENCWILPLQHTGKSKKNNQRHDAVCHKAIDKKATMIGRFALYHKCYAGEPKSAERIFGGLPACPFQALASWNRISQVFGNHEAWVPG